MKHAAHIRTLLVVVFLLGIAPAISAAPPAASSGPEVGELMPPLATVADDVANTIRKLAALE